jgi:acyl-CoA dehydrogenase
MISTLDETQAELAALAASVFARHGGADQVAVVEERPDAFHRDLWEDLSRSGLLATPIPDKYGGLGFGAVEVALVCEQHGRHVAPVPLAGTLCAAMLIAAQGTDEQRQSWLPGMAAGEAMAAVTPPQSVGELVLEDGHVSGRLLAVPWAHVADLLLIPAGGGVVALGPATSGVTATRGITTSREIALDLELDHVAVESIGDDQAAAWLLRRWRTALAATSAGVADGAVRLTASYTSQREQFGKPLSTFQAVALKAADAYLDATAIRAAARQAAWCLDTEPLDGSGGDADLAVLTAAWWAADAGQRAVHLTQHLHGGMGADITYPVHRFFLWNKQIELLLGGASALLAELGEELERRPGAGDAISLG